MTRVVMSTQWDRQVLLTLKRTTLFTSRAVSVADEEHNYDNFTDYRYHLFFWYSAVPTAGQ